MNAMGSNRIFLHKEKGVNPRLCVCPRCGKDNGELVFLGIRENIDECNSCHTKVYGGITSVSPCPKCGETYNKSFVRKIEDHEKVPTNLCKECDEEVKLHAKIVDEGGVYFTCEDCGVGGVLKGSSEMAKEVRRTHQRMAAEKGPVVDGWFTAPQFPLEGRGYRPCGIRFTKDNCPKCTNVV